MHINREGQQMMRDQAPNIDLSNKGGRLVYDKGRQTIVAAPSGETTANDATTLLREALAPFALIGALMEMAGGPNAIPDETLASRMRLDDLRALEFRAAWKAYLATQPPE